MRIIELIDKGDAAMVECYHCQNWIGSCIKQVTIDDVEFVINTNPEIRRVHHYKMKCEHFKSIG